MIGAKNEATAERNGVCKFSLCAICAAVLLVLACGDIASAQSDGSEQKGSGLADVLFKSTVEPGGMDRGEAGLEDTPDDALEDDGDGEPFVAPIPFRSPTLGWGGALAGGYIFRIDADDRESPPSTLALAGFGTENESFGGILSGRLHISEDRWRVSPAFAVVRANYDFFGIGSDAGSDGEKIEIEADIVIGRLEVLRRLPDTVRVFGVPLYMGPSLLVNRTENSLDSALPPEIAPSEINQTSVGYGIHLQRDSRDDRFYPMDGSLADLGFQLFESTLGGDFSYRVWDLSYARFDELWPEGVLASRVFGRFVEGDAPFTDLSGHDLRGYEQGRYRDKMHVAGEVEIRQHLFWRFGGAVFVGLGQVAPALDEFEGDRLLWSAGAGLRFRLTEQNRMNYRSDIAWGRDGFEFYFSITEEF